MSNAELKFPQWQGPLQELILEFDPQKMPEKIQSAETLVLERLQQIDPAIPDNQLRTLQRRVREWRTAVARRLVLGAFDSATAPNEEEVIS